MNIKLSDFILEQSISDASANDIKFEQACAEFDVIISMCEYYNKLDSMIDIIQEAIPPANQPPQTPTSSEVQSYDMSKRQSDDISRLNGIIDTTQRSKIANKLNSYIHNFANTGYTGSTIEQQDFANATVLVALITAIFRLIEMIVEGVYYTATHHETIKNISDSYKYALHSAIASLKAIINAIKELTDPNNYNPKNQQWIDTFISRYKQASDMLTDAISGVHRTVNDMKNVSLTDLIRIEDLKQLKAELQEVRDIQRKVNNNLQKIDKTKIDEIIAISKEVKRNLTQLNTQVKDIQRQSLKMK